MRERVEGVILAAGLASRMGSAKLELEIGGIPVIVRVLKAATDSRLHHITLVVGPRSENLVRVLGPLATHPKVARTVNPCPQCGMAGSLGAGIDAVESGVSAAMILLGDQPLVSAELIDHLLQTFSRQPDRIVAPLVKGKRSNPVIFPATLFGELRKVRGDSGGRSVVKRNADKLVGVEVGDWYDDADLDTPEDLRRMQERLKDIERQEQ